MFTISGGKNHITSEPNRRSLDKETYDKFFGLVKSWTQIYGKFCTKPQEFVQIVENVEFKELITAYETLKEQDQKVIIQCILDEVNGGSLEYLIVYYGCKGEVPEDYATLHLDMLGTLPQIAKNFL